MNNEIYVTQTYTINDNRERQGNAIDNSLNIYIVCDGNGTYNTRADLCVIFKKSKRTIYYNVYWDISEEIEIEGIQACLLRMKNQEIRHTYILLIMDLYMNKNICEILYGLQQN